MLRWMCGKVEEKQVSVVDGYGQGVRRDDGMIRREGYGSGGWHVMT